jgi:tagatose-6-phosphate ketose/aldose isomerase
MSSDDSDRKPSSLLEGTESELLNTEPSESEFLAVLARKQSRAGELLDRLSDGQKRLGYYHTMREILQQSWTWLDTCARVTACTADLRRAVHGIRGLVLTGSGSSEYAGECVRMVLQKELGVTAQSIGGGVLLTHGRAALPAERPVLIVSLARSGDSPESVGAVASMLENDPGTRHLVLTCNKDGALATTWADDSRIQVILLDDRTNDRSLAMTSSLTNLVLAARYLGLLTAPDVYRCICERLGLICRAMFLDSFDAIADVAGRRFDRVVYLGSGSRWGAARESALKMLEMTAGRVNTMSETWLGLRHGPMSYIDPKTLVVCFFSSDPLLRAYESDLLEELNRKQLGLARVIVGEDIPSALVRTQDLVIETPGIFQIGDENAAVLDVVVGQLLAFNRCLRERLQPDSPSEDGVVNRVVESFTVHDQAK